MTDLPMNPELVAIGWLAGVAGLPAGKINKRLPRDVAAWSATGFVQVVGVVGGSPVPVVMQRQPVIQVDTWAANPASGKPPWGMAAALAEYILRGCEAEDVSRPVSKSGYETVAVKNVVATAEPREVEGDPSGYAHYTVDIQIFWSDLLTY